MIHALYTWINGSYRKLNKKQNKTKIERKRRRRNKRSKNNNKTNSEDMFEISRFRIGSILDAHRLVELKQLRIWILAGEKAKEEEILGNKK